MCKSKTKKQNSYRKKFFRKNNPLLREASRIINKCLFGTKEERLGQFLMIENAQFKENYPDELKRKDIAFIVKTQLGGTNV